MDTETIYSKRGLLNKINIVLYILFNVAMVFWVFSTLYNAGEVINQCVGDYIDACEAGASIGVLAGLSFISVVWFMFGVVGAGIIYATRPKIIGTKRVMTEAPKSNI